MSNISFYGANAHVIISLTSSEHLPDTIHFEWVASLRACSMGFDVTDLRRLHTCLPQDFFVECHLRRGMWYRDRCRKSALVRGYAWDNRENIIAIHLGLSKALKHNNSCALTTAIPICCLIEWLALPRGAQETSLPQVQKLGRCRHEVDSSCNSHRALSRLESFACSIYCNQRR